MSLTGALALAGCSPDPQSLSERINGYRTKGDYAAAAVEVRNALKEHATNSELLLLAGQVLYEIGDLPNAGNALRRALQYGQPPAAVLPILGRVLVELEKYSELLEALDAAQSATGAKSPELTILRGRAYLGQGKLLEARTEFHVSRNASPTAAASLGLAQVALAGNDGATAERHLAEALAADPRYVDAHLTQAEVLRRAGQFDAAAAAYRKAIDANPRHAVASAALAVFELSRDALEPARAALLSAEKLAPQHPRVRLARAALALREKRHEAAIAELGRLLEIMPESGAALLLMGRAQYAHGRYDRAQIAFSQYLRYHAADAQVLRMLAATLFAQGQPHLALNVLSALLESTEDVELMLVAADAYRTTGRFQQARVLLQRALKRAPEHAGVRTGIALTDLAVGARERAVTGLESAIALRPTDSRADEALIMMLLGQGEVERAGKVADALVARLPEDAASHVLQAAVSIARKDHAAARASLDRALRLDPMNLPAVEALADVDAAQGHPDRRRDRLEAILKQDAANLPALLALARLDLAQGRHDQGVARVRRALATHPESANALMLLANAQFRHGQTAEAVISARQAHELHPYDTRVIAILGEAQLAAGDKQGAITTLARLTALQPAAVAGYLRLAAAHIAAGDTKNATAIVLAALEKSPRDRGAIALLADIYLASGDTDRMLALGARTQKDDPNDALGYRIEGDAWLARKQHDRALGAYRKAAAIQTSGALLVRIHQAQPAGPAAKPGEDALRAWLAGNPEDVETRLYLGEVLGATGRHREAAEAFREALKLRPNSARALNDLAWNLHAVGDRRSLDYARQAISLAPGNAAALDTLGWILVEQGNTAEGVPLLLKAVEIDAGNPEIRFHLVQALLKIGDNGRARAELKTLLAGERSFPQLGEARALARRLNP